MAETYGDPGDAILGFGTISGQGADLSGIASAATWAPAGVWVRLHLSKTGRWRPAPILQAAGYKRISDSTIAVDWQTDGSGLGERRAVIQAIVASQAGEPITWDLTQLQSASWTGTSPVATEPPFGWTLPKPELPNIQLPGFEAPTIKMPDINIDVPWVPLGIGLALVILLRR